MITIITEQEFHTLPLSERISYLNANGKFLKHVEHGAFTYAVYSLHNFHVEVINNEGGFFAMPKVISVEVFKPDQSNEFQYTETVWARSTQNFIGSIRHYLNKYLQ